MSMSISNTLVYIQREMTRYVYSTYLIFGVTGCCLNILLLLRRQFRTVSCCAYLLTASVTMLINLAFGNAVALYALNNTDPTGTILAFCKMRIYILQSSSMMYRWALVAASFDRYATSSANIHLRNLAKVHIARRVIILIICIWLILPIHGLIFYYLNAGACGIYNDIGRALYHSLFSTISGCILPVLLMTIFSVLLYRNLIMKRRRLQNHANQITENRTEINGGHHKQDQQILIMLLIQIFVYFITITPIMTMYLYNAATIRVPNKSIDRLAIERFCSFVVEAIVFSFPALSFYLFTMVSKLFRDELHRLLISIVTCKWNNTSRIEPTGTNNHIQMKTATGIDLQMT